jgi:hypothetical protein
LSLFVVAALLTPLLLLGLDLHGLFAYFGWQLGPPRLMESMVPLLILLTLIIININKVYLTYAGGLLIYAIDSNDRLESVRATINDAARQSLKVLYSFRDGDEFMYDRIAVVGYSVGSLIAYETLNALIQDDMLSEEKLHVADRTCLFETFGAPLDKLAFFFEIQDHGHFIRQALANARLPLVQSYESRKFPWVNVYSRNDIFSGPIRFYDDPNIIFGIPSIRSDRAVHNIVDKEAIVPLIAHCEYYKNSTVWRELMAHIAR